MSLRERKKRETRQALSDAALRLAVERGIDNVVVEDIATAANVSPRTFNNYFSSKQEAIVWRGLQRVTDVAGQLRERPASEPLWEAITEAAAAPYHGMRELDQRWRNGVQLMLATPSLQAEMLKGFRAAEEELTAAIAERMGSDLGDPGDLPGRARDLLPRLIAGAVGLATQVAIERWLSADSPAGIEPVLREALAQLATGLDKERN